MTEFVDELESTIKNSDELRESLADPGMANYVICWLRLCASAELQKQPDFYINFLPNVASVHDFCRLVSKAVTEIAKNANAFFRKLNLWELILTMWSLPP